MKKVIFVFLSLVLFACQDADTDGSPEISFDRSPVFIQYTGVSDLTDYAASATLQIRNVGGGELRLDSIEVDGDSACKFTFEGPDEEVLGHNASAFLKIIYAPGTYGTDNIGLTIEASDNNDENVVLAPSKIAVCGQIVENEEDAVVLECNYPEDSQPDCNSHEDPL